MADLNINVHQKLIEHLINNGYTIIQIFPFNDTTAFYFNADKFIPAERSAVEDIQYNQIIGTNITDFVLNNSGRNVNLVMNSFADFLVAAPQIRVEFPSNIFWMKYAKV